MRRVIVRLLVVFVVLCIAVLGYYRWSHHWRPDVARWPAQGVAVGPANAPVSWPSLARQGASFAYIDATAGGRWANNGFVAEQDGARAAGLRVGAIHQYSMCALSNDQASAFVRLVARNADALPPVVMLDLSDDCPRHPTRALMLSELSTFLNQIETHMGKAAIIAPSDAFEARYDVAEAINRPLWLRSGYGAPDNSGLPWVVWQANDALSITGATGPVRWLAQNTGLDTNPEANTADGEGPAG